jgi:hypothetical protein
METGYPIEQMKNSLNYVSTCLRVVDRRRCAYGKKKTKKEQTKSKRTARKKVAPMKKTAEKKLKIGQLPRRSWRRRRQLRKGQR